jgi:hypothetical protein
MFWGESQLLMVANAQSLVIAGRADATPVAGDSAQALETRLDEIPEKPLGRRWWAMLATGGAMPAG